MNHRSLSSCVKILVLITVLFGASCPILATAQMAGQSRSQSDWTHLEWDVQGELFNMYLVNASGVRRLILQEDARIMHSALMELSPDGQHVTFVTAADFGFRDATIWLIRSDGTERREILKSGEQYWVTAPKWSPDSQQIGFVKAIGTSSGELLSTQLWLYSLIEDRAKVLTSDPVFAPPLIAGVAEGVRWDTTTGLIYVDSQRKKLYRIDPSNGKIEESLDASSAHYEPETSQSCRGMVKPVPIRDYDGSIGNGYTVGYLDKYTYTSWEGYGSHPGVDIAGNGVGAGTSVSAVGSGTVVRADWGGAWGNLVIIRHEGDGCDGTVYSIYAHLRDRPAVGGSISAGTRVGYVGSTGNSTGAHLHFQIDKDNTSHPFWPSRSGQCSDCPWDSPNHVVNNPDTDNQVKTRTHSPMRFVQDRSGGGNQPQTCTDGEGVILYEHSNYQGRCSRFTGDDSYIGDNAIGNDTASSIRIIGNYQAEVFEHSNFGGTSSRFTGDDPDFGNDAIRHDRASSIRVSRRDTGGSSNCDGGQGVYLYEHPNYNGKCSKFTGDSPNPRNWYIGNDTASSIRIIGNYEATVYEHDDYNGASSTFSGDDPDFGNDAIRHDRASSIRVRTRQSGGSSNCDGGAGVYLYEHPNYQGRCSKFTSDSPNPREWYIGNDTASAIRILGNYAATVYEHDNYNGASSTFVGDDPDFGNDSIGHDRASSIRVRIHDAGPSSCNDGQFLAEYFNNRDLGGNPVFRRCESAVNYNWGGSGPGNGVVNDNFSVRWTGRFWFANDGIYRFTTRTDDGVRLIVDGQMLIQEWRDMGATTFQREKQLSSGMHTVRMEYYEHGGDAVAQLSWQFQSGSASDPDDGRTLSYDFGLDGTINPVRDRDDYYFDGSADQTITLRMDKRDSNIDSYLELYNPDGTLLAQDDDRGDEHNARIAVTLRQNGRHKVIAREVSDRTGGYRISLSRESVADPDDNRWISFGGVLEGTIRPNNDEDWYYFSGTSGRSVSIRMNKIDGGLDPYLELYNPNGVKVAYNDDGGGDQNSWIVYTLPVGGTYRIKARSYQLASSGRYRLSLQAHSNANLALNKGAWATSTEFNGVEPHKAFDGNLSTRWSSRFADPQFIYVDLGNVYTFNQVVLKWETAYGRRYGIFYWDGNAWQPIFWTNSGDGGTDTINFNPVRARYVGMYGIERGTPWGYSLWEFEVYDNTALVLPLVPPDPDDKEPDTVPEAAPLAPNDPDKATLLIGEGPEGQENTPLEDQPTDAPTASTDSGRPSAFILYPISTENPAEVPEEILFQGIASDNDEAGESIVQYRWTSNVSGVIGTTDLFRLPRTALAQGRHVITFEALDDEGNWSDPETVVLVIGEAQPQKLYLPLISR